MATLMMTCTSTGRPVSTTREVEWSQLMRLRTLTGRVQCKECGLTHEFTKERVWLR